MKYLAMIYNNPDAFESLSEKDRDALMTEADVFINEFQGTGEFLGGSALAHPATGKTVRVRNGGTQATDGPYAEAKEYLAGYYVLDVDSIERAVEIVAKDPASRFWAVEVRPIMDEAGTEM
ncbi:MAG: YciI family protein [Actinomycetota bacterium]